MNAKSAGFVQFLSRHYGDLRKRDTHFGIIGGAGLRAWNGSVVRGYAPTRRGESIKHVSRFRLEGKLFKHSLER